MVREPLREVSEIAVPLTQSFLRPSGAALGARLAGLKTVIGAVLSTLRDPRRDSANDPVRRARTTLQTDSSRLQELENQVEEEIRKALASSLVEVPS
jgi:hypothetical protein